MSRAIAIQPPVDYLRQARRLRAKWMGKPGRLHRELKTLNREVAVEALPAMEPGPAQIFSEAVAKSLDGPVLRYSARLRLLRQARRMGIERFEANLLIAAVQYRAGIRWDEGQVDSKRGKMGPVMLLMGVQALIVWVIWAVLQ